MRLETLKEFSTSCCLLIVGKWKKLLETQRVFNNFSAFQQSKNRSQTENETEAPYYDI